MSTKMSDKGKKIIKNTIGTLIIPALFAAILFSISGIAGKTMIAGSTGFVLFLISVTTITITTIALSTNLNSGRFDFSIGSIATLSSILAAKVSYAMCGDSGVMPFIFLILSILFGAILGLISGGVYVLLKLPPIIVSLGIALIYEGISFTVTSGKYLMTEVQTDSMLSIMKNPWFIIIILALVMAITIYLFDFTGFGYKYKSLKEGQKISIAQGIKEIPNALACYAFCGGLMGIVGFLNAGLTTSINGGTLNFASISLMFTAFLPMFIGGYIGKYSNEKLGFLLAGISMGLLNSFFSAFHNEIDSSVQSIINAVLLVLFLIYLYNEQKIFSLFKRKKEKVLKE